MSADEQRVRCRCSFASSGWAPAPSTRGSAVPLSDLNGLDLDPVVLSEVLGAFGRHRLLSFDRDMVTGQATVEVAHEALFSEWERLAGWIDRHRIALRRHEAFAAAVEEWELSRRDPDYLLTGGRLAEFEALSREGVLHLTGRERAFLGAGVARRDLEQREDAARRDRNRRLEGRARVRLVALVGRDRLARRRGWLWRLGDGDRPCPARGPAEARRCRPRRPQ